MKKRSWIFFYSFREDRDAYIEFARGDFKRPQQSKFYKQLQEKMYGHEVCRIGYCTPSDPDAMFIRKPEPSA